MSAKVVTFYSFKGGVGRTQALANMAVGLANRGQNVIAVDMDLESPGLHAFFYPEDRSKGPLKDTDLASKPGFIDFVEECFQLPTEEPKILDLLVPCTHPNHRPGIGSISLLSAGRLSNDYPERIGAFSWEQFYKEREGYRFMELFRDRLIHSGADYLLVDSRTGMTDVANICTFQLPDVVVVLFALHEQGIEGASRVAQAIKRAQEEEGNEARPRRVLLLPARVEESGDPVLRDYWVLRARDRLSESGKLFADLGQRIPYAAEFAYGEEIVLDAAEPSNLSRSYERLLEEILSPKAGAVQASSIPAPKRPSFQALRADLERLDQNVRAFVLELEKTALANLPLMQLRRFAHDVVRRRNSFIEEVRKIRAGLRLLAAEVATEPEHSSDIEVEFLETASDWIAVVDSLQRALRAQINAWISAQRRRIETRLLEVADQDATLVGAALQELGPWLESGELEEIDARLPAIEEEIARSGLDALLQRDALDRARLGRSRPDPEAQNAWLDQRVQNLLSEGSIDPAFEPMLKNLLRLRAAASDVPTPLHWSAYEAICARVRNDQNEAEHVFVAIGRWLWSRAWDGMLSSTTAVEGLRGLAGPEARRHLELTLRTRTEAAAELVQRIADGLLHLWGKGKEGRNLARSIVAQRRDDFGLRVALGKLGRTQAPPRARRELLASWLFDGDTAEPDIAIVHGLAEALVEEGYDAEAFYTLEAFRALGAPIGLQGGFVYLAFLLRTLENNRGELAEALLADQEIREQVAGLRVGKALFVLLAWQPQRFPEKVQGMRHSVLQSLEHSAALAPSLPPALVEVTKAPLFYDLDKMGALRSLERSIREEYKSNKFHGNWEASRHYEADFHTLVGARLEKLLRSELPREEEISQQEVGWDAATWIPQSFDAQKQKGLRTSEPDGLARKNMIKAFDEVQRRFTELARLRLPAGHPSLADMLEEEPRFEAARQALRRWILADQEMVGLERQLAERVMRLSASAAEEET